MRVRISRFVLWFLQLASLITILLAAWQILDREVFVLVAASIVLAGTLYVEHRAEAE